MNSQKQRKQKNGKEFGFLKEIDRDILINKLGLSPERVDRIFALARERKQFYLTSENRYHA